MSERARPSNEEIVEQHDPTHNRPYFVNKRTGKSGWTREEVVDQAVGADGGSTGSATGAVGAAHDELQERRDESTGRAYYVHTRSGKTGWTREAALEAAGVTAAGAPASSNRANL